jgi:hypothetical protein
VRLKKCKRDTRGVKTVDPSHLSFDNSSKLLIKNLSRRPYYLLYSIYFF